MTPPSSSDDPLSREIESALEGVDLQDLGQRRGTAAGGPGERGRGGRESRLWRGSVVGVSGSDVIVEINPTTQGVLSLSEFDEPPQVGQVFEFAVRGSEDGLWLLSRGEAKAQAAWNQLEPGARVDVRVTGQNTGGLEGKVGAISAFLPASHAALGHVEDLSTLLGQSFECEVIEADRERKRLVVSRRLVLAAERDAAREAVAGSLAVGQIVTGKVTRIEPFGAFVDLGGVEGLLHVSNISRKRVENPGELLAVDQEVTAKVLKVEDGGRRIGLGMKQLEADPWAEVHFKYPEGTIVHGKVARLMEFGAFVELEPGIDGLVHVSELAKDRVRNPRDVVSLGQELDVRVVSVDAGRQRIALSRLDERGAVLGSDEAVDSGEIDRALEATQDRQLGTSLGSLFKKALGDRQRPS